MGMHQNQAKLLGDGHIQKKDIDMTSRKQSLPLQTSSILFEVLICKDQLFVHTSSIHLPSLKMQYIWGMEAFIAALEYISFINLAQNNF
jgi:hypothetical protein